MDSVTDIATIFWSVVGVLTPVLIGLIAFFRNRLEQLRAEVAAVAPPLPPHAVKPAANSAKAPTRKVKRAPVVRAYAEEAWAEF